MNENFDSNDEKKESSKPKYWKKFWIAIIISYIGTVITLLFFSTNIIRTLVLGLIFGIALGIAYYIRVKPSLKINKIIYILSGVFIIGGGFWFLYMLAGISRFIVSLGSWYIQLNVFLMLSLFVIGGLIGYLIGKKTNYRLPFSLK